MKPILNRQVVTGRVKTNVEKLALILCHTSCTSQSWWCLPCRRDIYCAK